MKYSKELHERVRENLRMFDYPRFDDGDIAALLDEIDRLTAELAELRERFAELETTAPHQYNWEAHRFIKPMEA